MSEFIAIQPSDDTDEVDGSSDLEMLKMHFGDVISVPS